MNILFRADSSATIGTGHIMRDLVLAQQFVDDTIYFATQNLEGNINYKIIASNYQIEYLKSNKLKELNIIIKKLQIEMIIIDHYGITETFEKQLKIQNPHLKIMVLDDTYERHNCDILLNHNINANPIKYINLVPNNCELRCGKKFALLREEFYHAKKKSKTKNSLIEKNSKNSVLLIMGGADSFNMNINILKKLILFKNLKINVVTTSSNNNLNILKKFISKYQNITLHINSSEIAKLVKSSTIAITTPSVTINELIFMKLPFIVVYVAKNQLELYNYLKTKGFYCLTLNNLTKIKYYMNKILMKENYKKNLTKIAKIEKEMG